MKKNRHRLLLLIFALFPIAAEAQLPRSLILRMEWELRTSERCHPEVIETLIFRDGLVLETFTEARGPVSLLRGRAKPEDLRRFVDTLSASRVGFLRGSCSEDLGQPNALNVFTLTWFGKRDRRVTFEIRAPGDTPCPAETLAIRDAVFEFRNATFDSDPEVAWDGIALPEKPCPCTQASTSPRPREK
jgi:hypothetical protein